MRDSQEVLKRPAAGVVGAVSAAMGFSDLGQPELEGQKAAKEAGKKADAPPQQGWQEQVCICSKAGIV